MAEKKAVIGNLFHNKMLKKSLIYTFLFAIQFRTVHSQIINYNARTDAETYAMFMDKEWKPLLTSGNSAIKNEIDFYLLRLRMGVASDNVGKPGTAWKHYRVAKKFLPIDTLSYYYGYYSLANSGRLNEARVLVSKLTANQQKIINYKPIQFVYVAHDAILLSGTYANSLRLANTLELQAYRSRQTSMLANQFSTMFFLGKRFSLVGAFGYTLVGNAYDFTYRGFPVPGSGIPAEVKRVKEGNTNQYNGFSGLTFQGNRGWRVGLSVNYTAYNGLTDSIIENENTSGNTRFRFNEFEFNGTNYALQLNGGKRFRLIDVTGHFSINRVNPTNYMQVGASITYFPFESSKLFIQAAVTGVEADSVTNVLMQFKAGFVPFKWFWADAYVATGNHRGSTEGGGLIFYNTPDEITFRYGLNATFLIKKRWEIPLRFGILMRESVGNLLVLEYQGDNAPRSFKITDFKYSHVLIGTGIKFYF